MAPLDYYRQPTASSRKLEDLAWRPAGPGRYDLPADVEDASGTRLAENGYPFTVE